MGQRMASSEITELPFIAPRPRPLASSVAAPVSHPGLKAGPDRRATPRLKVELECEETIGTSRYFRITTDLSTFGLSTRQGFVYRLGKKVKLKLLLPDGQLEPLELAAEVVGHYDQGVGMRLAFRHPSVGAVRRIHKYLAARAAP